MNIKFFPRQLVFKDAQPFISFIALLLLGKLSEL